MERPNGFKVAGTLILGLLIGLLIFKGIAGVLGGIPGEGNDLVLAVVVGLLALLGWKRPLLGGILASSLGVLLAVYFLLVLPASSQGVLALVPLTTICAPMAVGGLLLIQAEKKPE